MSDEERLIEIEHSVDRHEQAITEDAKDVTDLKKQVQTLAREIERLNAICGKLVQTAEGLPGWVDRDAIKGNVVSNVKAFAEFNRLIAEMKRLLGP
jgi:hypothetical protein